MKWRGCVTCLRQPAPCGAHLVRAPSRCRFAWGGLFIAVLAAPLLAGCGAGTGPAAAPDLPRPIVVMQLEETDPARFVRLTGSVGSWKMEEIGFEVGGRVQYVVEPGVDVDGPTYGTDDEPREAGTLMATLDPSRYELQAASARSQLAAIERQKAAVAIEADRVIPAQVRSAVAEQTLAQRDFERIAVLFNKKITTQAEYDQYQARLESADAKVAQLEASQGAKQAELAALEAQEAQQQSALDEALRNVSDCKVPAPFRGQVAAVYVIPGGYVDRGQPVLRLQMMDPVKVEFEVSAETAARLNYKDRVLVTVDGPGAKPVQREAIVYMTDTEADPATRTFTVTLLARNTKVAVQPPPPWNEKSLVRTLDVWKIVPGPGNHAEQFFIESAAIHRDTQGHYVWKLVPLDAGSASPAVQRDAAAHDGGPAHSGGAGAIGRLGSVQTVAKTRIELIDERISLVGVWNFQGVRLADPAKFDVENDLVAGEIVLPEGTTELHDGDPVLFARDVWLLRPGALVRVELSGEPLQPGFYVPINAIKEDAGRKYVLALQNAEPGGAASGDDAAAPPEPGTAILRQIEVRVGVALGQLVRVDPVEAGALRPGIQLASQRVYYLRDGERVTVAETVEIEP